jgi:hypothetical protein
VALSTAAQSAVESTAGMLAAIHGPRRRRRLGLLLGLLTAALVFL